MTVTAKMVEAGEAVLSRWVMGKNGNEPIIPAIYEAMHKAAEPVDGEVERAREAFRYLKSMLSSYGDAWEGVYDQMRLVEDALAAIGQQAWRPIATDPPPHEVVVLLYWKDWADREYMEAARYSTGERLPNGYSNMSCHGDATHWRPLPAPPSAGDMIGDGDGGER